jgi:UDP-N-acetylmuramoylalanine--D-glutamate ligase
MNEKNIAVLGSGMTAKSVRDYCKRANLNCVDYDKADLIIASPGVPKEQFPDVDVPIISDIEWAYRLFRESASSPKIIAVTGTNGKSTVTALISHICDIPYAGNIGVPVLNYVGYETDFPEIVLEVSSYQLETCVEFKPDIAVMLNVSPDHLGRHKTYENYLNEKKKCCGNLDAADYVIYNENDNDILTIVEECLAEPIGFTGAELDSMYKTNSHLIGFHNYENISASVKVAECLGISESIIRYQLQLFKPLRNRLEIVSRHKDRVIVNDSKSTNPESTIAALKAFEDKPILICCGEDKGLDLFDLAVMIVSRAKCVVLFGDMAKVLESEINQHNSDFPIICVQTVDASFGAAWKLSKPGDVILFSPGSSSLDQFKGFEDRGNRFVQCVANYVETSLV